MSPMGADRIPTAVELHEEEDEGEPAVGHCFSLWLPDCKEEEPGPG